MGEAIRVLSEDAIIRLGGWHPRFARVLLIEHDEGNALVLVDGNGDGAELELEYWSRGSDGSWLGGSSSGHGMLDWLPSAQSWNAGDFVAALGRVEQGTEVSLEYAGHSFRRRANEFGIWGFVHAADSARPGDLPEVKAFRHDETEC